MRPIVIIPGYRGSGADHWQTLLEARSVGATRVAVADWNEPDREDWVDAIERAVASCAEEPVLVAHSLGCIAAAHWAARSRRQAAAALLVAPCDLDAAALRGRLESFRPAPEGPLPFPSLLVASTNDPYAGLDSAAERARSWGSRLHVAGALGHINVASGHGDWLDADRFVAVLSRGKPLALASAR